MDDEIFNVDGIEVTPAWSDPDGRGPAVFIGLDEFFDDGTTIGLTPAAARAPARKLTLTAEVAERGPRGNSRRFVA
jgi:hypothetical protein